MNKEATASSGGFVVSWIFGREYTDRTMKDLLALPVSRSTIVTGKFTAVMIWCALFSLVLLLTCLITGTVVGLETWSADFAFRAVPPLYSVSALAGKDMNSLSFVIVVATGIAGMGATLVWWRFADYT